MFNYTFQNDTTEVVKNLVKTAKLGGDLSFLGRDAVFNSRLAEFLGVKRKGQVIFHWSRKCGRFVNDVVCLRKKRGKITFHMGSSGKVSLIIIDSGFFVRRICRYVKGVLEVEELRSIAPIRKFNTIGYHWISHKGTFSISINYAGLSSFGGSRFSCGLKWLVYVEETL